MFKLYTDSAGDEEAEEGGEAGAASGESGQICWSDSVSVSGVGIVVEESEFCGFRNIFPMAVPAPPRSVKAVPRPFPINCTGSQSPEAPSG